MVKEANNPPPGGRMSPTAAITGKALDYAIGRDSILSRIDCRIATGRVTALVGRNGSGKSTLMRLLARLDKPSSGEIMLNGTNVASYSTKQFSRHVAFLPQDMLVPPALSVHDLVACGRHPHRPLWKRETAEDRRAIDGAIEITGLAGLAARPVGSLSGGERQRALIAMALAQQTEILLLDEPTTYLDLNFQVQILELVRLLNRERGTTVVWILHDLNQAIAYSDDVVVLSGGRVMAHGQPAEVLTPELIASAFGLETIRLVHPVTGTILAVPAYPPAPVMHDGA